MKYQDFSFTKKSYLHRAQWRYYFYLSRVRILVSPWLLTWLANYKTASRSGARPGLILFTKWLRGAKTVKLPLTFSRSCQIFPSILFPSLKNIQEDLPKSRKVKNSLRGKKMQTVKKDLQQLKISQKVSAKRALRNQKNSEDSSSKLDSYLNQLVLAARTKTGKDCHLSAEFCLVLKAIWVAPVTAKLSSKTMIS